MTAAAMTAERARTDPPHPGPSPRRRLSRRQVAGFLVPFAIALAVYGTWLAKVRPVLTGDEPCYLVQAYSLVQDGDLDLSNNFDPTDRRGVVRFTGDLRGACADQFHEPGRLRPRLNPGTAALLAPAAWLVPRSLPLLRVPMVLIAALWAQQLYALLRDVEPHRGRRGVVELVWVASGLLLPALGYSNQLYPEVPAALCVTIAARCLLRASRHRRWMLGAALATAPLPWLHTRFALIAVVLTLLAALSGLPRPSRRCLGTDLVGGVRRLWWVPLPLASSVLALGAMYLHLYGSISPAAPYSGGGGAPLAELGLLQSYRVGVGTLLGATSGVLPVNPFLWLGLAGLGLVIVRWPWSGTVLVLTFVTQLFVVNPLGFFAYTLPGRFVVALLPLLAVGALLAVSRAQPITLLALLLAVLALVPVQAGWWTYGNLYDVGRVRTPLARRTEAAWPPVQDLIGERKAGYLATTAPRQVGRVGVMPSGGNGVVTSPGDGPGLVVWGPPIELLTGPYRLTVTLAGSGPLQAPAARLRVRTAAAGKVVAERSVGWAEVAGSPTPGEAGIELPFLAPAETIRVEVESTATGELTVGSITAHPSGALAPPATPVRRGFPLALLWFATTTFVAALLTVRRPRVRASPSP